MLEKKRAEAAPQGRDRRSLETGQRRHAQREALVALRLPPQHQADEQGFHDFARRALLVPHQVSRQLDLGRSGPDIGERHNLAALFDDGDREVREVVGVEEPERESFLGHRFLFEPRIRDRAELRHDLRHPFAPDDVERCARLFQIPQRLASSLHPFALERKRDQIDERLLAELDEGEPEVRIPVQLVLADFVKHRRAAEVVALLQKQPNQV